MNIATKVRTVLTETGAVLQNNDNGAAFSINLVGAKIWQQLSRGASKDDIVIQISNEYGIPRDQAYGDVEEFLRRLEDNNLLRNNVSGNHGP